MRHQYLAALTAAVALMLGVQTQGAEIVIGDISGAAGSTVGVDVTLNSEGEDVAGTQNDITFPTGARINPNTVDGGPDCAVNPAINKPQSTFAFLPNGCTGTACTGIRSLVLAFGNVNPIADGARLYTCQFTIGAEATGALPLVCAMPGASDPDGGALPTTCVDGEITTGPTPTPTEPPLGGTTIRIGSGGGEQGDIVPIEVTLDTEEAIAGTQNDITFSGGIGAQIIIPRKAIDGSPDCTVNPAINKPQSTFAFLPNGCEGELCTGIRSLILAFGNVNPIPTGSVLYTCNVQITTTAADGEYPLTCSMPGASDPDGGAIETGCTDGAVTVGPVVIGTVTNTPSPTPTSGTAGPTATPTSGTAGPTATPTSGTAGPTATPTRGTPGTATRTPIRTDGVPTPRFTVCDDSCSIASPAENQNGWLLLLPAAMLIWLRRRSR